MFARANTGVAGCLVVVSLLLAGGIPSLALDPAKAIPQYIHDVWEIEDGLPQNSVNDLAQDGSGYLWLATLEGLVRFDGVKFTVFNKAREDAFRSDEIRAFYLDPRDVLWIATYGGGLLRLKDGEFRSFGKEHGLADNRVWDLSGSDEAGIWLATHRGLYRFDGNAFTGFTTEEGLAGNDVRCVYADEDGRVWAGTMNGLSLFENGSFRTFTTADGLAHDKVKSILRDSRGRLWVGTHTGVSVLANGVFTNYGTRDGLVHDSVIGIFEDHQGAIWLGTEGGISRFHEGSFTSFTEKEGLSADIVRSFLEDREGSLWIGTETGGLNRLREGKFTAYTPASGLPAELIWSFYETRDGRLLIGSNEGLIVRSGGVFELHRRAAGAANRVVSAVYESSDGTLWAGTPGDGLFVFEAGAFRSFPGREQLSRDYIHALLDDPSGGLWIGTRGGLRHLQNGKTTTFTKSDGLPGDAIRCIAQGANGALWIGTGTGLSLFQNGEFTNFSTADGLSSEAIFSTHRDADGTMWFGTYGGGLNRYRDGQFHHVTSKDGLFDDVVYVILEDGSGNLWMSGNKGVFSIAKREFDQYVRGQTDSVRSISYGVADGMKSRECNGGLQWAGCRTRAGRMWFPTIRGAVSVDPDRMPADKPAPPVYLEKVVADGRDWRPDLVTEFAPGTEKLEFHYTALSYAVPKKVQFRYMLEGYDKEWVDAGTRRVAYYTNLRPGNYTFRVRACNADGVWNHSGAAVSFRRAPFFYETPWFVISVIAVFLLILFAAYRRRMRQMVRRAQELEALVARRTQELREATLRDDLTGLRNRRFLQEILQPETSLFAERKQFLAQHAGPRAAHPVDLYMGVFVIDIDHFKQINDTYGHGAGDRVLQQFATVLGQAMRKDDIVVRWGGEEFLVVLRHTAYEHIAQFATEVRRRIESSAFAISEDPDHTIRRTCSIGYAPFPFHCEEPERFSFDQAVMLADLGLYRAKRTGRNRTVGVMPTETPPSVCDVAPMVASLEYGEGNGILEVREETAMVEETVPA